MQITPTRTALLAVLAIVLVAAAAPKLVKTLIPLPLKQIIPAGQRICNAKTPSGLGTLQLRPGTAARPTASDGVRVNYIGYLAASGEVFDQGWGSSFPSRASFRGSPRVCRRWARGNFAALHPAALGYGAKATGPIPANSDLVFQVELVDILAP